MQIQDANLKRPVVLNPGNSLGGGRASGLLLRASSGKWTSCIIVMEDSKKSFRDPGVKKHNFFVRIVYGFKNLHPLKTSQHQGTIVLGIS